MGDSRITEKRNERIIVNDRFGVTDTTTTVIYLPEVDVLGTQFVDEILPYRFTSDFIDLQSELSGMLSSRSDTDSVKAGWKSNILDLI